jgi:hypothetical protein
MFFCCGCDGNEIEEKLVGAGSGCCYNCLCYAVCGCCVIARNSRATKAWELAGKPKPNSIVM